MTTDALLTDVVAEVVSTWTAPDSGMTEQSIEKFSSLLSRFTRFAKAHDVDRVSEVDEHLVAAFVGAKGRSRHGVIAAASLSTQHNRRSVLRTFARDARRMGYRIDDPTRDLTLPFRVRGWVRPLTLDEADLLRHFAESWERPTRHATAVALALAGLHTGEIGSIRVEDVRVGVVLAPGTRTVAPREVPLDRWSTRVVNERTELVRAKTDKNATLISTGTGTETQRQARTCTAIREVIRRAGLDGDPEVKPASLTSFAGLRQFEQSRRIEDAARLLGSASLDRTATTIGWTWDQ